MANIVLINPRFEVSYWGLEHALPFVGKRANLPIAALPLLAALTPAEHNVTLVDGPWVSVQEDYFGDRADVICVGEAEETWPRFLEEWQAGRHQARYEQA